MARRTSRLWPSDDDLQSLQPVVAARHLATPVRESGRCGACARRTVDRQQPCEGAPLGGGLKKGEYQEAIGRSRGGRTCKIHCLADDRGRPVAIALTPGNVADITMAIPLLSAAAPSRRLLADKAYDADALRNWLADRRIKAVIPSTASRRTPYPLDRRAYRRRNVIERFFGRLKNWRRIATRYDRHASNYLAAIALVATVAEWTK